MCPCKGRSLRSLATPFRRGFRGGPTGATHFTSQSEGRVAGGDVGPRRPPARNACYDEPALPAGGADLTCAKIGGRPSRSNAQAKTLTHRG